MATAPTVNWQYSDWRIQPTLALQLERLKLHLQEVSGLVLESTSKGRTLRLDAAYLPMLNAELQRLETRFSFAAAGARFGVASFRRGSGP
jgi:hypothetical protein